MICIVHGYLLDGSGSNLWTRSILHAMCRQGRTVHLISQETDPAAYDFIAEAHVYGPGGTVETTVSRDSPYPGRCIMHKPTLGETLPVYVWDQYEDFDSVVPMTELDEVVLEDYLVRNVEVIIRVIKEHGITALHVNHAVLMAVAAQRASVWTGVPYAIMPHGSALEYAVRPDARLRRLAADALAHASQLLVISDEVAQRVDDLLGEAVPDLRGRITRLDLGVDTSAFRPVPPAERAQSVQRVKDLLADVPRGRSAAQSVALAASLEAGADVADCVAAVGEYDAKSPDEDVEQKLDSVRWETAGVLAFVGRLIAAKGIHAVIGSLPLVLERAPGTRMLVVGHGPLREPLELLVHALASGDRDMAERVIAFAATIETGEPEHLQALPTFWRQLAGRGELDNYWASAARLVTTETVQFTGYLTHREMSLLLPCCDAAIFPSMVIESGPLVFLEALASGVFPVGTYFGGMKVKIDRISPSLAPADAAALRVRPEPEFIVSDIVDVLPAALRLGNRYRDVLRDVAVAHYDWAPVAERLAGVLDRLRPRADGAE